VPLRNGNMSGSHKVPPWFTPPPTKYKYTPIVVNPQMRRRLTYFSHARIEIGGVDFIRFSITGDSFVFHQIRKLVGTIVAIGRGVLSLPLATVALKSPFSLNMPLAPAGYLLLDYTPDSFHNRRGESSVEVNEDQLQAIRNFKLASIYPHIADLHMLREDEFRSWLLSVDRDFGYRDQQESLLTLYQAWDQARLRRRQPTAPRPANSTGELSATRTVTEVPSLRHAQLQAVPISGIP